MIAIIRTLSHDKLLDEAATTYALEPEKKMGDTDCG